MDVQKFKSKKWKFREEFVEIPELKDFFAEGEQVGFLVRGLSGIELFKALESAEKNRDIASLIGKLLSNKDSAGAIAELYGMGDNVPDEVVKRFNMLIAGCVKPKVDIEFAKIFCKTFPIDFKRVTDIILKLSGEGAMPGE